jgi:hypothetical protein
MTNEEIFQRLKTDPDLMLRIVKKHLADRLIMEDVDDSISYIIGEELKCDDIFFGYEDCEEILKIIQTWCEA